MTLEFSPKYAPVLFDFYNILTRISEFKSSSSKSGKTFHSFYETSQVKTHQKKLHCTHEKLGRGFLCSGDRVKHLTVFGNKLIVEHHIIQVLNDNAKRKCL